MVHEHPRTASQTVFVQPESVLRVLLMVLLAIQVANAVVVVGAHLDESLLPRSFARLVEVDSDTNIVNWWSSLTILLAALAAFANGRLDGGRDHITRNQWYALAAAMLYLAADEAAAIHERLSSSIPGTSGIFHFAWVIPMGTFAVLFAFANIRLLQRLDPGNRKVIITSGLLFVAGAGGMELLEGWWVDGGRSDAAFAYDLMTALEEGLEGVGIALLVYALCRRLAAGVGRVVVELGPTAPPR